MPSGRTRQARIHLNRIPEPASTVPAGSRPRRLRQCARTPFVRIPVHPMPLDGGVGQCGRRCVASGSSGLMPHLASGGARVSGFAFRRSPSRASIRLIEEDRCLMAHQKVPGNRARVPNEDRATPQARRESLKMRRGNDREPTTTRHCTRSEQIQVGGCGARAVGLRHRGRRSGLRRAVASGSTLATHLDPSAGLAVCGAGCTATDMAWPTTCPAQGRSTEPGGASGVTDGGAVTRKRPGWWFPSPAPPALDGTA